MKRTVPGAIAALCVVALIGVIRIGTAAGQDGGEGPVYLSVFWVGQSETVCTARGSILTDSPAECNTEYVREEAEIKKLVQRKKARGGEWMWGVFEKCTQLPGANSYDSVMAKYKDRCSGK